MTGHKEDTTPVSIRISGMKYNEIMNAVFNFISRLAYLEILFSLK
jgi:hypothetical protein